MSQEWYLVCGASTRTAFVLILLFQSELTAAATKGTTLTVLGQFLTLPPDILSVIFFLYLKRYCNEEKEILKAE